MSITRVRTSASETTSSHLCSLLAADAQTRVSLRKTIEAFSGRVTQLTDFILAHGLEVPAIKHTEHATLIKELTTAYGSSSTELSAPSDNPGYITIPSDFDMVDAVPDEPAIDHASTSSDQLGVWMDGQDNTFGLFGERTDQMPLGSSSTGPIAEADWLWNLVAMDDPNSTFGCAPATTAGLPDASLPMASGSFGHILENSPQFASTQPVIDGDISNDEEDHAAVTSAISDRLGRLLKSSKGEWRFYGATSNMHLVGSRHIAESQETRSSYKAQVLERLESLNLSQDIPLEICEHFIKLYFTWHNASVQIVDEDMFAAAEGIHRTQGTHTAFYSEVLLNAMYALWVVLR